MRLPSLRAAAVLTLAAFGLGACTSYDGYGYTGLSVGYGSAGYYDPYYGSAYHGGPAYGWFGDFYYPGHGYYVYDRRGARHRWTDDQRRHWEARRDRRDWREARRDGRDDRREWRRDGGEAREWRERREVRGEAREVRREVREVRRDQWQERRGEVRREMRRESIGQRGQAVRDRPVVPRPAPRGAQSVIDRPADMSGIRPQEN